MPKTSDRIIQILERLEQKIDNLNKKVDNMTNIPSKKKTSPKKNKKKVIIKTGNIVLTKHPNGLILTGDTYDKRAIIKKYSGWWTPEVKGWTVRNNKYISIKKDLIDSSKTFTEKVSDKELVIDDIEQPSQNKTINSNNVREIDLQNSYGFISDDD